MVGREFRDAFQKYLESLNAIREITGEKPKTFTLIHCKGQKTKPAINLKLINRIK